MTELDLDLTPDSAPFEAAYAFPASVDVRWKPFYEEAITRMRNESRILPMGTVQRLLVGEIAYLALILRAGEVDGDLSQSELMKIRDQYTKLTIEFNRMLTSSTDKARTVLMVEIKNILIGSLRKIRDKDADLARDLNREWNEEFAALDIS